MGNRAYVGVAAVVLAAALVTAAPAGAGPDRGDAPDKDGQIPGLAYSLQDDAGGAAVGRAVPAAEGEQPGTVTVVAEAADDAAALAAIRAVGGTDVVAVDGMVQADVPRRSLQELAGAAGVRRVREPRPVVMDVASEGVAITKSAEWQAGGFTGAGVSVAVIDGGFSTYEARLGTDLPATVATDFSRCSLPRASEHGTAVADVVHDMAPDAALRLICIETDVDFIDALDDLPADVDVVNGSIGFTLLDRGDGSGPVSAAVARLRERGVLYVAAAGNYEGTHRHQAASGDTPGESLTDLVNLPGGDDALTFVVAPHSTAFVSLQWDAWPTTSQDFDLFLVDLNGNLVGGSAGFQDGDDPPIEFAQVTNASSTTKSYFVLVNRYAGRSQPRLDLFFDGGVLGIEAPTSSSIADPAVSSAAFSAGAHCYADGSQVEPFSSRGPTIDGRTKPDIVAPDGTTSVMYGLADACGDEGFFGTSAAAPHVAGAAAQVLEANPGLDVAELQQLLEDRALENGPPGDDNAFGSGLLRLGGVGDGFRPAPLPFTGMTPTRLFDSRPGVQYPAELPNRTTPFGPNGTVRVQVRDIAGVPDDAQAVLLNVTAVSPTTSGWATVFPSGAVPNVSNVNFAAQQTAAVQVTAKVADDHRIAINNALGSTHFVVDITGWYGGTTDDGPGTEWFTPLASPLRAMDTRGDTPLGYAESRLGPAGRTTPIGEDGELAVRVAGLGGVPADATAVMVNLTAIAPTKGTFLTAFPAGVARPDASNLNAKAGQTVANLAVIPVGDDGDVRVYNQAGATHLALDVLGYYRAEVGTGYVPLDPTRTLDTRSGTGLRRGPLGVAGTHKLKVARYDGVPGDASAVMLSVAAVSPTAAGWLTVFPATAAVPTASTVNFAAGSTIANATMSRLGTDGRVAFRNAKGTTHVISDLVGYFIDPANVQLPPPG